MRSNASTFRRQAAAEEAMMRAAMPRTSARDVVGLRVTVTNRGTARAERFVPALTFTLREVANG